GRRPAHRLSSSHLVPDLAVLIAGAFKQAAAAAYGIVNFHAGQDPVELAQDTPIQIGQAWIFGGQINGHAQRLANLPEGGFVRCGNRVAPVLAQVPTGTNASCGSCDEGHGERNRNSSEQLVDEAPAGVEPSSSEPESCKTQYQHDRYNSQAQQAVLEYAQCGS